MNSTFLLDAVPAAIILLSVLVGAKKGFIRTVIAAAVYIAAVLGSGIIGDRMAEPIYMRYFRDKVVSVTDEKLTGMREEISDSIRNAIGVSLTDGAEIEGEDENLLSGYLTNPEIRGKLDIEAEKYLDMLASQLKEHIPSAMCEELRKNTGNSEAAELLLGGDMHAAAEYIELNFLRPPLVRSLRYAVWSISFALITLAGRIITAFLCSMKSFETIRTADTLLGAVSGLAVGAVVVIVLTVALKFVVSVTPGEFGLVTENTVSNTVIYKFIYNTVNF